MIAEEHEANVGPWVNMARRLSRKGVQVEVRWWKHEGTVEGEDIRLSLEGLGELLGDKTRLVAFTACSNLLGELTDIKGVADLVRTKSGGKAKTVVDCVAYAPHRRLQVEHWGVDFAFFSYYKVSFLPLPPSSHSPETILTRSAQVYGPHCSVLYAHPTAIAPLSSLAHFFLPLSPTDPYKLAPGGSSYELTYGSTAVATYLLSLAPSSDQAEDERLDIAFDRIAAHEELLAKLLLNFLTSDKLRERGVRIVGPKESGKDVRAPTISFVVRGAKPMGSQALVDEVTKGGKVRRTPLISVRASLTGGPAQIGIRWGHFYAVRLVREVAIDEDDGVVRISLVHYSTVEEVQAIIQALEKVLA